MQAIYTVCEDEAQAERISESLVGDNLVVCTNYWEMNSVYEWNGEVEKGDEVAMIIKTKVANVQDVFAKVKELHSYDTPALFVLPTGVVEQNYLEWVQDNC